VSISSIQEAIDDIDTFLKLETDTGERQKGQELLALLKK